ncbi:MAG: hypothetical protein HY084_01275 [Gemmatimonadetes bacterium]|nr:hypothetical protein [Gemmatimonadota bacterium]
MSTPLIAKKIATARANAASSTPGPTRLTMPAYLWRTTWWPSSWPCAASCAA